MLTTAKRLAKGLMVTAGLVSALAPIAQAGEREWCPPGYTAPPSYSGYGHGYGAYPRYPSHYGYRYGESHYDRWGRYVGRDVEPRYGYAPPTYPRAPSHDYVAPGYGAPGYSAPAPSYGSYAPGYGSDDEGRWSHLERAQYRLGMMLGQIHYVKDNCTRQTINMTVADEGAATAQMSLASPTSAFHAGYRKGQEMSGRLLQDDGKDKFCQATWKQFGRNGSVWANLLMRPEAYK